MGFNIGEYGPICKILKSSNFFQSPPIDYDMAHYRQTKPHSRETVHLESLKAENDLMEFAKRCEAEKGMDLEIEQVEETMVRITDSYFKKEQRVVKIRRVKSNNRE